MDVIEFGVLTPALRQEVEGDEDDPFDARGSTLQYQAKEQHVGLVDQHGLLVASTGLVVVEVEVGPDRFPVVGLGGVIVNQRHRGRGLARRVVGLALERAQTLGPSFAVLFCHEDRAGLYRKLDFAMLEGEVLVQQPDGWAAMPLRTMWRALHADAVWPRGSLRVNSLPF
jgi:predicted N-acetyltransferase YhbS